MKTVPKLRSGGESCSCTTCVYKSESGHPSLRRFIDEGSRIDRLYYGKYIPLREKKLLDRLVRTRGVYDDIRAQLVSDSTLSLSTKGDFRKNASSGEQDDTEKRSAAMLKFVNMVDKGATLGSAKLSDCCSCCSCSSKIHVQEDSFKRHRHKRALASAYDYRNARERKGQTYKRKKGVRFQTKHIRSDPCTCTFKFSGLLKNHSKNLLKKIHPQYPLPVLDLEPTTDQEKKQKRGLGDIARASYQNLKRTNIRLTEKISEGMIKIKESQTRMEENLEMQSKKSLEKLTQAQKILTSKVKASAQNLRKKKTKTETMCLCPNKEIAFQVQKDSISKFKEELRRKQIMKDWECEPECIKHTCVPEECFIRLKDKRSKQMHVFHKGIKYRNTTQEQKAGESLNLSVSKIQTENQAVAKNITTEKHKPTPADYIDIKQPHVDFEKATKKKIVKKHKNTDTKENTNICACETSKDIQNRIKLEPFTSLKGTFEKMSRQNIKSRHPPKKPKLMKINVKKEYSDTNRIVKVKASPLAATSEKRNTEKVKASSIPKKNKILKTNLERKSSQRQAVRIGSSFSFNIEFYRNKVNPEISKIHFRNPADHKQRSGIDYRYKKSNKDKKTIKTHLQQQGSQIILKKSLKDTQTGGHALRRCFCTLKLKAKTTKSKITRPTTKKIMTTEKSVLTLNSSLLSDKMLQLNNVQTNTVDQKITERKKKKTKSNLLPYECESGICVPGDCNPYQCIQLINMRESKYKRKSDSCACPASLHSSRKTKSTSSFTSKSHKPPKAKYVQSMLTHRDNTYSRPAVAKKNIRKNVESKPHRQAVRVGSTFSFNIEFYKGMPNYNARQTELKRLSIKPKQEIHRKAKLKERGFQSKVKNIRRNTPTQMHKKERNIGTALKRCFCTLRLQKKGILKTRSKKTFTIETNPINLSYSHIDTANKSTKIMSKYIRALEPSECAPFTCIPESCDPYICLNKINKRNVSLKEVGFTTKRPETITNSTTHSNKSLKTAQVQHKPRHKQRKVLAKPQKIRRTPKKYTEKKPASEYSSNAMSNHAVKIGSTFNFDIEFYKKNAPTKKIIYSYPSENTTKTSTVKIFKNKGRKQNKLNVANIDKQSQVDKPKKFHKTSVVSPLLKRCFCTLNLQKKRKPIFLPEINYTVNRAIVQKTPTRSDYEINVNQIPFHNSLRKYISRDLLSKKTQSATSTTNVMYNTTVYKQKLLHLHSLGSAEVQALKPVKTLSNICARQNIFNITRQSKKTSKISLLKHVKEIEKFVQKVDLRNFKRVATSTSLVYYNHLLENYNNLDPSNYFGRCFYAMNFKVENRGIPRRREIKSDTESNKLEKRALQKLKYYECEPGVCIPGECNPYECKKLISKRLRKNNVKKSGNNYKSQSVSSSTSEYLPKFTSNKQQTLLPKSKKHTVYKERPKNGDKQAVRIGSSFSFDIQFSKNFSISQQELIVPKYSSDTKLANSNTKKKKKNDSHSQSGLIKTRHKDSLTLPARKRCFCTLKLQKKGRLQREIQKKQQLSSDELYKVQTTSRGQNTKKFKPLKIAHSLKPYECEPNICIPSQCDPYECLEIMKRRNYNKGHNEFGTTTLPNKKSISSTTDDHIKLHRSRAVSVNPKRTYNNSKVFNNYFNYGAAQLSRNSVRVGSSFSFNIEFLKGYSLGKSNENKERKTEEVSFFKKPIHLPKKRYHPDMMREYPSNYKKIRHNGSQIKKFVQSAATLTNPAIKRCFCTAQLDDSKNKKELIQTKENKNSSSFLNKCLCLLKRMKRPKNLNMNNAQSSQVTKINAKDHVSMITGLNNLVRRCFCTLKIKDNNNSRKHYRKKIDENFTKLKTKSRMTVKKRKYRSNELMPFECEPNICTPYHCNPYECEKLIKLRHKKQAYRDFGIATTYPKKMTTASITDFYKKPNTKSRVLMKKKYLHKKARIGKHSDEGRVVESKQSVRLGSTFGFDVEFSKDKQLDGFEKRLKKETLDKDWRKREDNHTRAMVTTKTYTGNERIRSRSTMTGLSPLKRCFCTLSLRKPKEKEKQYLPANSLKANVTTKTDTYKITKKPMLKLLPHECEPNICIPGECNPIECLERIKKRYKNIGIAPGYTHKKNVAVSMATEKHKIKNKKSQLHYLKFPIKSTSCNVNPKQKFQKESFKQAVRIGSSFRFDVEFFKNKISDKDGNLRRTGPHQNHEILNKKFQRKMNDDDITRDHKKYNYLNKDLERRKKNVGTQKIKTIDTQRNDSFINTLYKRCFCVFKLHKIGKQTKQAGSLKYKTGKTQTLEYDKRNHRGRTLERFECEPNICIPGKCNPYECEQLIRKRLLKEFGTHTEKPSNISTFSETNKPILKPVKKQTFKIKNPEPNNDLVENDVNRQVVRVGSNFSFDVEFFKTKGSKDVNVFNKSEVKSKMKSNNNKVLSHSSQVNNIKKDSKSVSVEPFFKRCFCILKLQKTANKSMSRSTDDKKYISKQPKQHVLTENKCITTNKVYRNEYKLSPCEREPFNCIPGESDPFLCKKRIKLKEKKIKVQNTQTKLLKCTQKRVGSKQKCLKSQKNQISNFNATSSVAPQIYHDQTGVVEIPRFTNILDRGAVRIGSKFSFNLEFYKETRPQTTVLKLTNDQKFKTKNRNNVYSDDQRVDLQTCGSEGNKILMRDKSIEAANVLKKCFCTLKLQNLTKLKTQSPMKQLLVEKTKFPQTFEVRRVDVQQQRKMLPKYSNMERKSIGTKISKKYIKQKRDCKICFCQNGKTIFADDMKTILPYRPTKFNKAGSLAELPLRNIGRELRKPQEHLTTHGKRLTSKRSKKFLHCNKETSFPENSILQVKFLGVKPFLIRCAQIIFRKTLKDCQNFPSCDNPKNICEKKCNEQYPINIYKPDRQNKIVCDGLKPSKSEQQARFNQKMIYSQPKKTKSLKLGSEYVDNKKCTKHTCPYYANPSNKKFSYQGGDVKYGFPVVSLKINRKQIAKYNMNEEMNGKNKYVHRTFNVKTKPKSLKQQNKNSYKNENFCAHCFVKEKQRKTVMNTKGHTTSLKFHYIDSTASNSKLQRKKSHVKKIGDCFKKPIKQNTKSERHVLLCKYCHSCGRKFNKEEFDKAAGDQLLKQTESSRKQTSNGKDKKNNITKKDNVCSGKDEKKPLFEIRLDSSSYDILDKDVMIDNVTKFNKRSKTKLPIGKHTHKIHGKSCRCCICLAKRHKSAPKINVVNEGSKICKTLSTIFHDSTPKIKAASGKPCICGSLVCAKKAQKIVNKLSIPKQRYKWKRCVCGSTVCDRESAVMKTISGKIKCVCQKEIAKRNKVLRGKKMKKENKERAVRLKQQKKEDRKRKKERHKDHKRMERRINKNASDLVLLSETAIDIGKLGVTACCDVLRLVARSAQDPKHAYNTLKTLKDNPKLLVKHLKSAYAGSGVAATTRRVRLRCMAMRGIKTVRAKLENFALTKYLLHIASKDPKRRLVKPQRVRERFDFGCSLYMGSLRKRPFLSIYDRCPAFYPHCLSLVNVWKQFMDITLFLLAVVVWSPCILCMELCRACMCCFFCTG